MAKNNLVFIKNLPVGSIIKSPSKSNIYEIRNDGLWILQSSTMTETPRFLGPIDDMQSVNQEYFKIIYPHGYNSPLWKVLNGEDYEE